MCKRIFNILLFFLVGMSVTNGQLLEDYYKTGGFARIKAMGESPFLNDPTDLMQNPAWGNIYPQR